MYADLDTPCAMHRGRSLNSLARAEVGRAETKAAAARAAVAARVAAATRARDDGREHGWQPISLPQRPARDKRGDKRGRV